MTLLIIMAVWEQMYQNKKKTKNVKLDYIDLDQALFNLAEGM